MKMKPAASLLLYFITIIGVLLRINALSPFKFYPDAYQSLLVAENIRSYHSVVGYLGESGGIYPPFVMWSRPGFPLLLNLVSPLFPDSAFAAIAARATHALVLNTIIHHLLYTGIFIKHDVIVLLVSNNKTIAD